jgi:hypothetical protein
MLLHKNREVTELEDGDNYVRVHYADEPEHKSFYAPKSSLIEANAPASVRAPKITNKIILASSEVSFAFITALKESPYDIRIKYPEHAEQSLVDSFNTAGVVLPTDIRPQDVGSRVDGAEAPRSWSATVIFPNTPVLRSTAPDGTLPLNEKFLINSKRAVVLALLKSGFDITNYTKV